MIEGLNEQQLAAVKAVEGPVIVFAGAGSGKTHTLTTRIAYMIAMHHISPYNILAITFTNKAANEMKERIRNYLDINPNAITICTFHSLCARILRKEISILGYTNSFTIIDEEDQAKVISDILKEKNEDTKQAKRMLREINNAKCFSVKPEDPKVNRVYMEYEKRLKELDMLDFEDLLIKTYELFNEYPEVLEKYQDRYQYISIDEFQDTNLIQYKIAKLLASKYRNLFVVGDDDQSIYSFRGTNYENINNFKKDFKDCQVYELTQNYRSTQSILDVSNRLIAHNKNRHSKKLFSDRAGTSDDVIPVALETDREEVQYVLDEIFNLKNIRNEYKDFAILYRSSSLLRNLEQGLIRKGFPYKVYGGLSYLRRREVKDVLAYLKLILNDNDLLSFKRIVNTPTRGIGLMTVEKVERIYFERKVNVFEAIDLSKEYLTKSKYDELISFKNLIMKYRKNLNDINLIVLYEQLLDEIGYLDYLKAESENENEYEDRLDNVNEFKSILWDVENSGELNETREEKLRKAFDSAVLSDEYLQNQKENPNGITVSTIHSVKGLEFKYVFVIGLEENIFPNTYRIESDEEFEEERRIAYVAFTRAKDRLFLTRAKRRLLFGGYTNNSPSTFLVEALGVKENEYINADTVNKPKYINYQKNVNNNVISRPVVSVLKNQVSDTDYQVSDTVVHTAFGEGIILSINNGIGTIFFNNDKITKKIMLKTPALSKK